MEVRNAYEILGTKDSPTEYLIEGLLPVGLTIFTGREKIGKSFFLLQLAGSICSGKNFLGKSVNKSEVLYLALEDTDGRLNHRMRKQSSFSENLNFITKIEERESLEEIINCYMRNNPKCQCIIVDHFLLAEAGAITAEYDHDLQVARKYKSLADQYKLSLILVIHEKKGKANSQIEKIIGRGLGATADCILRLSRNDNTKLATLYSAGRDITEKNIVIEFDDETCTWNQSSEQVIEEIDYNLSAIINYVVSKKEVSMSAQELASTLKLKLNPISIASLLDKNKNILDSNGISFERGRTNGKRKFILKYNELENVNSADSAD